MRKPMTKLGNGMLCSLPVVMLVWTVLVTPARAQFGQQAKLVGSGGVPSVLNGQLYGVHQGWSVSISGDGNTAIVGGPGAASDASTGVMAGTAWVWTRSGGGWTRQQKLFAPPDAVADQVGAVGLGSSVSLSGDGNSAILGGPEDSSSSYQDFGAAWVYTRSGVMWTPFPKLADHSASPVGFQGFSASLSGDGNTVILGGYNDSNGTGAAWVYVQPPPPVAVGCGGNVQRCCEVPPIGGTCNPGLTCADGYCHPNLSRCAMCNQDRINCLDGCSNSVCQCACFNAQAICYQQNDCGLPQPVGNCLGSTGRLISGTTRIPNITPPPNKMIRQLIGR